LWCFVVGLVLGVMWWSWCP